MLHAETDCGNADPTAKPHKDRFSARFDKTDDVGVEANRRHSHDNKEFAEFFQRAGDGSGQGKYGRYDGSQHKKQDEPREYFFEAERGAGRCVQLFFFPGTHESKHQCDRYNGECTRELDDSGLIECVAAVYPLSLIHISVIFAMAFTACAAQPAEESAQIANPWTEAADAQEVQDKTGIAMSVLPEDASDAEYSVMEENKTAQVAFHWKGDAYLYRGMPGKADGQTLAGLYGELEHIEEITPEDIPENGVQLSYTEGEMGYAVRCV